jgi:two-component system sensor histidine kinase GlrK
MLGQLTIGAASRSAVPTRRKIWRWLQPRSVLGLVLFGFALVGAPLTMGLLVSGMQIAQLTRDGEHLLEQAVGVTRAAREVADRVLAVERAARQYQVLRDRSAKASLAEMGKSLVDQVHAMSQLELEADIAASLDELVVMNDELAGMVLSDPGLEPWPDSLDAGFREFNARGRSLVMRSDATAEHAIERLRELGDRSRGAVNAQIAATIPIATALAIIFVGLITRPIRRLDKGIRALAGPASAPIPKAPGPRDLQALSVRLEWVRRKLLRTERDRQRLLAQVSHELKTPLSAIREGVGLLEEELLGPLDARQAEVVTIVRDSVERLQRQIEALLRYNKLRSRPDPPEYRPVQIASLVAEVLAVHRLAITARGIVTQMQIDDGLSTFGDHDMLRTALDNLVSNAVKFAERGRLGVFVASRDGAIVIEVADSGAGIDPADRRRVFEPFYRGRQSTQGNQPGSGLGLAICRDLVRAHGGDVCLVEKTGWRTVFQITLPNSRNGDRP